MEVLAHICASTSKEIQCDIHALVEAANLRCLESSISQHRLQRIKEPSMEIIVECGRVIKEILYAVDRVNAQAIHKALLLSAPQPSSRLITLGTKVKNIITVSQHVQQAIQGAVDRRNAQYIQDYITGMRLRQLKASCLEIRVECDRTIREIFKATDRLDAQFIEQFHARRNEANRIDSQGITESDNRPSIVRIGPAEPQPRRRILGNGVILVNLDVPEPFNPNIKAEPDSPEDDVPGFTLQ